jgi:RNA recognition motif-containing protein
VCVHAGAWEIGRQDSGQEIQMKLYVGNLSKQVTDAQLNELATPYGKPVSANVATERNSGESKGFGFIEFSTADEAKAAITGLDGRDVNGQALKVNEAKPRKDAARF